MPTAWLMRRNSLRSAVHGCISTLPNALVTAGGRHTLRATGDELSAVLEKGTGHLEQFLGLVHCGGSVRVIPKVPVVGVVVL